MTASDCRGAKRILAGMSLLLEGNGGGEARLVAVDARGVPPPGGVLHEPRVAGAEDVLGSVAEPDLELTGKDDHELAPRGGMPVDEVADRALAERDLGGREPLGPRGRPRQINWLNVGLPVLAGVEPECLHGALAPAVLWGERGDYIIGP